MESLRWATNFMCHGEAFHSLWRDLGNSTGRNVLLILGAGFDPRATNTAHAIKEAGLPLSSCLLIDFDEGRDSASHQYAKDAQRNREKLDALLPSSAIEIVPVQMRSGENRNVGGLRISGALSDPKRYQTFTDVVVDITALPRGLYFPAIGTLLDLWFSPGAEGVRSVNLHVVVCENATVDQQILEEGGDKVEWVHGFSGKQSLSSGGDIPRVWAPVLGGRQRTRLAKIYDFVDPLEIWPVLPFPASDPRRGDKIISEYRELIFEAWRVEHRDILYADEQNPFDVYRQLCYLDERYKSALKSLGGATTIVSAHSSKLLSLGVLLAAFEKDLGVPNVEPTGYVMQTDSEKRGEANGELFEVWLAGEAYGST